MSQEDNNCQMPPQPRMPVPEEEAANISEFISNISQEKYAAANKYLQELLDAKLKARIQVASTKQIF